MRLVAQDWTADQQEIEGVMNLVKIGIRMAPGISLQQLDARVGNRKSVGLGSRSTKHVKFSELRPAMDDMLDDACDHYSEAITLMSDVKRFQSPGPARRAITEVRPIEAASLPTLALKWAVAYNVNLQRAIRPPTSVTKMAL